MVNVDVQMDILKILMTLTVKFVVKNAKHVKIVQKIV